MGGTGCITLSGWGNSWRGSDVESGKLQKIQPNVINFSQRTRRHYYLLRAWECGVGSSKRGLEEDAEELLWGMGVKLSREEGKTADGTAEEEAPECGDSSAAQFLWRCSDATMTKEVGILTLVQEGLELRGARARKQKVMVVSELDDLPCGPGWERKKRGQEKAGRRKCRHEGTGGLDNVVGGMCEGGAGGQGMG